VTKHVRRGSTIAIVVAAAAALTAGALPASAVITSGGQAPAASSGAVAASDGSTRSISASQARALGTPAVAAGSSHAAVARAFAVQNSRALGLRGDLGAATTARSVAGGSVVRLPQTVGGVPVLGAEVVVDVSPTGAVRGALSETLPGTAPATTPTVSAAAAAASARALIARDVKQPASSLEAAAPTLNIYDPAILGAPGPSGARLVWRTEVTSSVDVAVRRLVLVDAQRGTVALTFDLIDHAKNRTVCDANNVRGASVPCSAPVRTEGGAPGNAEVETAYAFAGATYDFYRTMFGRDSIDGQGMTLISTVNYCDPDPLSNCPYDNAFWDGSQMVYGAGFASADDVVAHELTHGVTERTSGLFYFFQSGAINESLSDIFGEYVDLTDGVGNDTAGVRWQLGEDLPVIGAIRNMKDPTLFGDPDSTQSTNYFDGRDQAHGYVVDSGGVHYNSGVGNKFAYLLTDGDTFRGRTVRGLGINKAAQIIYAASQLLTPATDYRGLAAALRQACSSLASAGTVTASDCTSVNDAIAAVSMDAPPLSAPTAATPAACPAGTTPVLDRRDSFESPAAGGWTRSSTFGPQSWYWASENPYAINPVYPTDGGNNLWGDDPGSAGTGTIAMSSSFPVNASSYVQFDHAFSFDQFDGQQYDGGVLLYSTDEGSSWHDAGSLITGNGYNGGLDVGDGSNPLNNQGGAITTRPAYVGTSSGYQTSRLGFGAIGTANVRLAFVVGSDSAVGDYGWFVDNLRFGHCDPVPTLSVSTPAKITLSAPALTWSASDATGLSGFAVRSRSASARSGYGAYGTAKALASTARAWTTPFTAGVSTCAEVVAFDAVGGRSTAAVRCTTTPVDEVSLTKGARNAWTKAYSGTTYRNTITTSKRVGDTLTLTGVRGHGLVLVIRTKAGGGKVGVYIGSKRVALVSTAGKAKDRVLVSVSSVTLSGATVKLKVESAGTTGVSIDGLAVRP
jgi:Zn-dependent metalloprotease